MALVCPAKAACTLEVFEARIGFTTPASASACAVMSAADFTYVFSRSAPRIACIAARRALAAAPPLKPCRVSPPVAGSARGLDVFPAMNTRREGWKR